MRCRSLGIGLVLGILVLSLGTGVVYGAHGNFSPQKIWSYEPNIDTSYDTTMGIQKDTIKSSIHYDVNGDGINDVLVEIHNYTAKTYTLVLLSGSDGSVLYKNKFTDIASTHNGNRIGIEANYYGIVHTDSSGNVISAYQYMVFQNASDTHRISIYKLNSDLSNQSYTYIEIPSTITTSYGTTSVSMYKAEISIMNFNYTHKEGLLFMGFYMGTVLGYYTMEVQAIMLDYNLNVIWEKKLQTISQYSDFYFIGTEPTDLNGWGFNNGHSEYQGADIVFINESSGNTVVNAVEATDGSTLWNVTIPGIVLLGSPIGDFGPYVKFIDYNHDHNLDLEMVTYDYKANLTYIYFISSLGKILGRYTAGIGLVQITDSLPAYLNETTITRTQDLNNDSYGDLVFVDGNSQLVAFDIAHNQTIYQKPLSKGYIYIPSLSRNDINGDSTYDIYIYGLNFTTGYYWNRENITAINGKNGTTIWSNTYNYVVGFGLNAFYPVNVSDINGDGFSNDVIIQGYYSDINGVYANATIISLKNGSSIRTIKIQSTIYNTDYSNWTTFCIMPGDVNGDGINDLEFIMYYHTMNNSVPMDDTFIRFFSGINGTLLWRGEVYNDHTFTQVGRMSWKDQSSRYMYRAINENNTIIVTTGYSVQAYEINTAVPEFSHIFLIPLIMVVAVIYFRKK